MIVKRDGSFAALSWRQRVEVARLQVQHQLGRQPGRGVGHVTRLAHLLGRAQVGGGGAAGAGRGGGRGGGPAGRGGQVGGPQLVTLPLRPSYFYKQF